MVNEAIELPFPVKAQFNGYFGIWRIKIGVVVSIAVRGEYQGGKALMEKSSILFSFSNFSSEIDRKSVRKVLSSFMQIWTIPLFNWICKILTSAYSGKYEAASRDCRLYVKHGQSGTQRAFQISLPKQRCYKFRRNIMTGRMIISMNGKQIMALWNFYQSRSILSRRRKECEKWTFPGRSLDKVLRVLNENNSSRSNTVVEASD